VAPAAALPEVDDEKLVHAASASSDDTTSSLQPEAVWACMMLWSPGPAIDDAISIQDQDRAAIANFSLMRTRAIRISGM
jgi:hypothetical protein